MLKELSHCPRCGINRKLNKYVIIRTMMSSSQGPGEKEIFDWGTQIGVLMATEKIEREKKAEKHQVEQIIASLENTKDPMLSLLVTALFAQRQATRKLIGRKTADHISFVMKTLYEKNRTREEARKILGMAKWVYEIMEERPEIFEEPKKLTLEDFIKKISSQSR